MANGTDKTDKALQAAADIGKVVGDVVVGLIQNKTQKDFNKAQIKAMENDSRLKQLSDSQRLALDTAISKAVNDTARLRIYNEVLSSLGVAEIESTGKIYEQKIKIAAAPQKTMTYIVVGVGAILIISTVLIIRKKQQ